MRPTMARPFAPSELARPLLERARLFVDRELIPLEPELLSKGFVAMLPELDALRAKAKEAGLWAPFLPVSLGGAGLGLTDYAHVSEVLGRTPLGHYALNCQAPDVGNMELLHAFGTDAQKERWLAPLTRGEIRSCFGMTEPEHAGSNPVWLSTRAVKDGDDYVIHGHKWFTTGIDGAAFCIVMAVTDPDAPSHARASQIIVPTDTPGLSPGAQSAGDGRGRRRLGEPREIEPRGRARAAVEPDRRRGRGLSPRAGAPRPRAHPPRDALDRRPSALRAHVR
jgi:acyl-CoA dehydrogenase